MVMTELVSTEQMIATLRGHPLFAALSDDHVEALADLAEPAGAAAGQTLITEGDPPGDVFVVLSGRLAATVAGVDGGETVVGEIGPGEVVGEMSVLSDLPRSASVHAIRDTTLLRIPRHQFHDFIAGDASSLLAMSTLLVRRLEAANRARDRRPLLRTLAVVPTKPGRAAEAFSRALAECYDLRRVALVDRARIDRELGDGAADAAPGTAEARRITAFLHDLEVGGAFVVLVADADPTEWTTRAIRQADRVLLLASGDPHPPGDTERSLLFGAERPQASVDLVFDDSGGAAAAASWLEDRPVARFHHVDPLNTATVHRLVRSPRQYYHKIAVVLSNL